MLISMVSTSSRPMSAMNLRPDRKYQGRIPATMMVAVNMIALPVVVSDAVMVRPQSWLCAWYSSQIRDSR